MELRGVYYPKDITAIYPYKLLNNKKEASYF